MSKQRKPRGADHVSARLPAPQPAQLNQTLASFSAMIEKFVQHSSINLRQHQRRQRALASYVFGMLLAYGKQAGLPPATVLGAMNMLLVAKWGYAPQAADHLTHELLGATQPGNDPLHHAIIYRGISGFTLWTTQSEQAVLDDFQTCVANIDIRNAL